MRDVLALLPRQVPVWLAAVHPANAARRIVPDIVNRPKPSQSPTAMAKVHPKGAWPKAAITPNTTAKGKRRRSGKPLR